MGELPQSWWIFPNIEEAIAEIFVEEESNENTEK